MCLKETHYVDIVGCRSIPPHGNEFSRSLKGGEFFGQMGHCEEVLLLLRKQGSRHTPQMHRSLEAYCATLGPP